MVEGRFLIHIIIRHHRPSQALRDQWSESKLSESVDDEVFSHVVGGKWESEVKEPDKLRREWSLIGPFCFFSPHIQDYPRAPSQTIWMWRNARNPDLHWRTAQASGMPLHSGRHGRGHSTVIITHNSVQKPKYPEKGLTVNFSRWTGECGVLKPSEHQFQPRIDYRTLQMALKYWIGAEKEAYHDRPAAAARTEFTAETARLQADFWPPIRYGTVTSALLTWWSEWKLKRYSVSRMCVCMNIHTPSARFRMSNLASFLSWIPTKGGSSIKKFLFVDPPRRSHIRQQWQRRRVLS